MQLVNATQDLAAHLQTRQQRVKAQVEHRQNFGAMGTLTTGDITRQAAAPLVGGQIGSSQQSLRRRGQAGGQACAQPDWMSGHKVAGLDDDDEGSQDCVISLPSATMLHDQMQLERHGDKSRLAAAEGVERMITELAGTFQQMAGLVSQHGELIQSIDTNVDQTLQFVDDGESNLSNYLNNISSDRAMVIKVFIALLVFGLIFMAVL